MFCKKCGNEMPDDATVCASCGTPTEAPDHAFSAEEEQEISSFFELDDPLHDNAATKNEPDDQQEAPKRKKKTALRVLLCAVALLLLLSAAAFAAYQALLREEPHAETIRADVSEDGTAHLYYGNGKLLSLSGVEEALMTPDQKKVVVLEKGGDLYWTNVKLSEKHVILSAAQDTAVTLYDPWLYDDSVFYFTRTASASNSKATPTLILYRYSFKDETNVKVYAESEPEFDALVMTEEQSYAGTASAAIARDGWIEVLNANSSEFQRLTQYDKEKDVRLLAISADGDLLIWATEENDDAHTLYYAYNGTVTKLKDGVKDISSASVSADGKLALICYDHALMYIRGEQYESVHFPNKVQICGTEDGHPLCNDTNTQTDRGCFVQIKGDTYSSLYYVDLETATKHKLLNAISVVYTSNNKIIYKNAIGNYVCASFDPKNISIKNEQTVTSDDAVRFCNPTKYAAYVIFMVYNEEYNYDMVDLYCYDVAQGQSKLIASNVLPSVNVSECGTKLCYIEGVDKSAMKGTLVLYDLKKNVSKQIAIDTLTTFPITSHFANGILDPNAFFYTTVGANVYYYNGKTSVVIIGS